LAVVVVALGVEVGVDIERVKLVQDLSALAERCLCEPELRDFRQVAAEDALEWFTWYWTRKEALLKAAGTGLLVEPDQVDVRDRRGRVSEGAGPAEEPVEVATVMIDPFGAVWRTYSFQPLRGWMGAVAVGAEQGAVSRATTTPCKPPPAQVSSM